MRRLYIDVSVLTLATFITGIQRVTREVCLRIADDPEICEVFLQYNALKDCYHEIDSALFVRYYREGSGVKEKMVTKRRVDISEIGPEAVFFDIDAVWLDRMKRSFLLPQLKAGGAKICCFLYDLIPIYYPQTCIERTVYNFLDYLGAHMQFADLFLTTAQETKRELSELSERVGARQIPCEVVPLGSDIRPAGASSGDGGASFSEREGLTDRPFLLMVGTVEPRKNHKLLLDAYDLALRERGYRIVFAGYMGWNMEEFEARLHAHPDFGTGIRHYEGLGDADIRDLYEHARFLIFSSYSEGYGLPVVEAIQKGLPVMAADIPVIREVGGDACEYFPQDDPGALCEALARYEGEEDAYRARRDSLKGLHFPSWDEAYGQIAGQLKPLLADE
ncbi:MAG: glycosyltransferase family 4 protein [Lachnospiraceae bacterium]|nr:glycosyltransferase family 4 protein [Lachnospiraceae bacterium]